MRANSELAIRCEAFWLQAGEHEAGGRIDAAWACLEAAHIVGQRSVRLHCVSHLHMLKLAWRTQNIEELIGQSLRLVASLLVTGLWVPVGNNGRANVSAFSTAPIPQDLQ